MEALLVDDLPEPPGWQYEPKWDGFRAIIDREGDNIEIWSKSGKRLGRFFPEIVEHICAQSENRLVLDGELVIPIKDRLSFEALQARLHPAESRIAKLSRETPSKLILFDAVRIGHQDLREQPLTHRREALRNLQSTLSGSSLMLSPASLSLERAKSWLNETGGALDGVIAKPVNEPYRAGERTMRKVKHLRTADCVVGGYRKANGGGIASLLLGLYNAAGDLDLVGFCSGFHTSARQDLHEVLKPFRDGPGFTGRAPGRSSRWAPEKSGNYVPLTHDLVVEVIYDQVTAHRFRHGTRFHRWRPDKDPGQCTLDQLVREVRPAELIELMGEG